MTSKKDLQLAYGLAIVLFVASVLSYAYTAFSAKPPAEPVRIMYKSVTGNVLFSHKTHTSDTGYGVACFDCHHHPAEDESSLRACGDCHNLPLEKGAYPESCVECHDEDEFEDTELPKRGDAFHKGCVACHQEVGSGPNDPDGCGDCHAM